MRSEFIKRIKYNIDIGLKRKKKISEILPIKEYGVNLINKTNGSEVIDKIVEEPLRKMCKDLMNKGIETVMSSANRENLLKEGEKRLEREDIKGREYFLDSPTYESAGKGYAWVMLNYNNLSDENKEELFSIEETKNSDGINIGEKIVWFIKANSFKNIFSTSKTEKEQNNLDKEFEKRSFVLTYNSGRYPKEVVFLRMPIDDKTTVANVEEYFDRLTERLKEQQV